MFISARTDDGKAARQSMRDFIVVADACNTRDAVQLAVWKTDVYT